MESLARQSSWLESAMPSLERGARRNMFVVAQVGRAGGGLGAGGQLSHPPAEYVFRKRSYFQKINYLWPFTNALLAIQKHATNFPDYLLVEVVDASVNSAKKDRLTHSVNSVLVFPFKWRFDGCFL